MVKEKPTGQGPSPDQIVKQLLSRASKGDSLANYQLAILYEKGKLGLPQMHDMAAKFYEQAALQGDSKAQCNLGRLYEMGLGVEKNDAISVKYFARSGTFFIFYFYSIIIIFIYFIFKLPLVILRANLILVCVTKMVEVLPKIIN